MNRVSPAVVGFALALLPVSVDAADFELLGASAQAPSQWVVEQSAERLDRTIEVAVKSSEALKGVRVEFPDLPGPSGQLNLQIDLEGKPLTGTIDVGAMATLRFRVQGTLASAGVYRGRLTLTTEKVRQDISLAVTRKLEKPPLTASPAVVRAVGVCSADATIRLLVDTAGETRDVAVEVSTLRLKVGERFVDAMHGAAVVVSDGGLLRLSATRGDVGLKIPHIEVPGEFTGFVRLSSVGALPVDVPLTVLTARPVWFGYLLVLLGVAVSALLRFLLDELRPRLLLVQRIQKLEATVRRIATGTGTTNARALPAVLRAIAELESESGLDGKRAEAGFQALQKRVEVFADWADFRRQVTSIEPSTLRAEFLSTSDSHDRALANIDASEASIGAITGELANERKKLIDRINEARNRALEEIKAVARQLRHVDPLEQAGLKALIGNAEEQGAVDRLESLQQELVGFVTNAWERELAARQAHVPYGFTVDMWTATVTIARKAIADILGAANEPRALRAYQRVRRDYTIALATPVAAGLEKMIEALPNNDPQGAKLAEAKRKLLDAAETTNDMGIAYTEATKLLSIGGPMGSNAQSIRTVGPDVSPSLPVVPEIQAPGGGKYIERMSPANVRWLLIGWAVLSNIIVYGLAALAGTSVLKLEAPTWGSWPDMVAAVLWGLGLQQTSGVLDGLVGVKARLTAGKG